MAIARFSIAPLLVVFSSTIFSADGAALVNPLKNQEAIRGCSWSATAPPIGNGFVFLAEWDESRILMNIDGVDVALQVIDQADRRPSRSGDTVKTYRAPGIEVKATYTVTRDCAQSDSESCEVTGYAVIFEVSKGARSQTVRATGEVGC